MVRAGPGGGGGGAAGGGRARAHTARCAWPARRRPRLSDRRQPRQGPSPLACRCRERGREPRTRGGDSACGRALVLASCRAPMAHLAAEVAERSARLSGLQAPRALAYLALAKTDVRRAEEFGGWARTLVQDCGLVLPQAPGQGTSGGATGE